MKYKNTHRLLILFIGLLLASVAAAKSPVFKVTKGENHLYIGGTIHLLAPSDYPLPVAFDKAFDDAEHVYFESDASQMELPEVQTKVTQVMTLPQGKTLQTELSAQTYAKLEAFLTERQIPIVVFNQLTPAAVSITLTVIELQRLGVGGPDSGVDHFYELKTKQANKTPLYLESLEEQIGFLNSFNEVDPNAVIESTIADLSELAKQWDVALKAWRIGDLALMGSSLSLDEMKSEFPVIYKTLLTDRNDRWVSEIELMLESDDIELILVGAAHLVEGNGVIKQLEKKGFTVEQLD